MPKEHAKSEERIIIMIDPRNECSFVLNHTRIKNLFSEGHMGISEDDDGNMVVDLNLRFTLKP